MTDAAPTISHLLHDAPDPGAVAFVEDLPDGTVVRLGYADAAARVDGLAAELAARSVTAGAVVGLAVPKSVDALLTIHAVLACGAVVVPIDPRAAAQAIADVVTAASPVLVVTGGNAQRKLDTALVDQPETVPLDVLVAVATARTNVPEAARVAVPSSAAYVIFTSGSTGVPKGIVHDHASARAYADAAVDAHELVATDVVAGIAPLHFDQSTVELYAAPIAGCAVAPVPDNVLRFPGSIVEHSIRHSATVWYSVPTLFAGLLEHGGLADRPPSTLRVILYGGEPFAVDVVRALMDALPDVRIQNVYGPAETNGVSVFEVQRRHTDLNAIPIGHPWAVAQFDLRPPADGGEYPELWLAGPTLMRGYLGRDDLTAERIVVDDAGTRWYRSGDLVETTDEGLVFRGRVDHQVKVRGVRIELEAVEATLERIDGVEVAVVASNGDGLVAALACDDLRSARRGASAGLSGPALPTDWVELTEFPTTQSGKLDRSSIRTTLVRRMNNA